VIRIAATLPLGLVAYEAQLDAQASGSSYAATARATST
jgi:hypothetical protein